MKNFLKLILRLFDEENIEDLRDDFGKKAKYVENTARGSYEHARKQVQRGMDALRRRPHRSRQGRLLNLLMGFGVGIGVGVLFAPTSGEMTRRRITNAGKQFARSARSKSEDIAQEGLQEQAHDSQEPEVVGAMSRKAIERQRGRVSTRPEAQDAT